MEISIGKTIVEGILLLDSGLGKIDDAIFNMHDNEEKEIWKSKLGNVMKAVNEELLYPILKQHPELDKDA